MRVALIFGVVFGPLAVMALNTERNLKAAHPGYTLTPASIRGGTRQPNNLLRAKRNNDDNVSAWFQSVRAPLTSSPTSISHRI